MITGDMNNGLLLRGFAAAVLLLLPVVCFSAHYRPVRKKRNDLLRLISQDQYEYVLVDLRNPEDYESGHIPGAMSMPMKDIGDFLPTENMFETIFVYGYSRSDSRRAQRLLDTNGYFNVHSFGPFRHWKGPFESGSPDQSGDKDNQDI